MNENNGITKNYVHFGTWWSNSRIELIKIGKRVFALNGWDGVSYRLCWECANCYRLDTIMTVKDCSVDYDIRPVYAYELDGTDISLIPRDSDEWTAAHEVMRYIVTKL